MKLAGPLRLTRYEYRFEFQQAFLLHLLDFPMCLNGISIPKYGSKLSCSGSRPQQAWFRPPYRTTSKPPDSPIWAVAFISAPAGEDSERHS